MSKEEFLLELRRALAGEVSQNVIQENLRYYDGYITDEARKGSTEEEVIETIGSPRLIARTIIDADEGNTDTNQGSSYGGNPFGDSSYGSGTYQDSSSGSSGSYQDNSYQGSSYQGSSYGNDGQDDRNSGIPPFGGQNTFHSYDLNKWYVKLALFLIPLLVIFLVVTIIGGIFTILSPFIVPLMLIIMLGWMIGGRRR